MCEYCESKYNEVDLRGNDGIVYNEKRNKYYLYAEHYRNEVVRIDIEFCPKCGCCLNAVEKFKKLKKIVAGKESNPNYISNSQFNTNKIIKPETLKRAGIDITDLLNEIYNELFK